MCGFTGATTLKLVENSILKEANQIIDCRGPDSTKSLQKKLNNYTANLWFNRLSILDLSNNADQPMTSEEFKTTILFNGEIFNHNELRINLKKKGIVFKTSHSDTETLLIGLSVYGINFIKQLRGQFSIVFLDERSSKLYLIRDRLGQKPLYYNIDNNGIIFGSSLLSLLKIQKNYELDEESIYSYLNLGMVSSPNTLFKNFYKVKPAEIIEVNLKSDSLNITSSIYWETKDFLDDKKFVEEKFFEILSESVYLRSKADVPVANFLSGGLDSTTLIKSMHNTGQKINAFSVYFENKNYDESKYIKEVVKKYNLNHSFVKMSSNLSKDDILNALNSLDEPYSDPSVVPSFILSKEISNNYKVAISGDGGDELLGGYDRILQCIDKGNWLKDSFSKLYNVYPAFLGTGNTFLSKTNNLERRYRSFLEDENLLYLLGINADNYSLKFNLNFEDKNYFKNLQMSEYKFYLPEMMMFKIDRTSMANSLEIRSPFVDHKLIEYIMLSDSSHFDINSSKKVLKNYLKNDFEYTFLNRKKQGFVFDVEDWVYQNLNYIKETIINGKIINNFNLRNINLLKINKSRINGQRLWKMFVLENYLSQVSSMAFKKS